MSAPCASCARLDRRHTRTAVATVCSADGRISSRAPTRSSRRWLASRSAPGYSLRDVNDWFEGQMVSGERLVPQTSTLEARTLAGDFAVPVFVIPRLKNFTTPTSLALVRRFHPRAR